VSAADKLDLNRRQRAPQPFGHGDPPHCELSGLSRLRANVREAQEVKRLAAPPTLSFASSRAIAAKLDEAGFVRVQMKAKLLHAFAQGCQAGLGIRFVLKANDEVIRIADDVTFALSVAPSPLVYPEVEHVVQEHISEQR
jgi:hypothetical protein